MTSKSSLGVQAKPEKAMQHKKRNSVWGGGGEGGGGGGGTVRGEELQSALGLSCISFCIFKSRNVLMYSEHLGGK